MGLLDKVKGLLSQNADKVGQAVDKAQEVAKDAAKKAVNEGDQSSRQS